MSKLNKVNVEIQVEKKVDNRVNNTGRPVNKKSARQIRLAKQAFYKSQHDKFTNGNTFNILNNSSVYTYECDGNGICGVILNHAGSYVCTVNYIGRTKVTGYVDVLGKRVNVEINLKEVNF